MEPVAIPAAAATATAMVLRPNGKDSRWLTLEVCPEFLRSSCQIADDECRLAHPPSHVEIQNGRVMCCYDSIKGKCSRTNPPCKYLHPPAHLKDQLLETGRQNLIQKNLHTAAMASSLHQMMPMPGALVPVVVDNGSFKQVLPSNYQTMVVPGQYPFMQPSIAQPYAIQSSTGLPLQYLNAQQGGYAGRYIQMVNPSANTLSIPSFNTGPAAGTAPAAHMPMATLMPGVPGAGYYGSQMAAMTSPLTMANQMEFCYLPDGSYAAYQASSYPSGIGEHNSRQAASVSSNPSSSAVTNQFPESVSTASSDTAQSYALATSYAVQMAYQSMTLCQLNEA